MAKAIDVQIIKLDETSHCNLEGIPSVKRVFGSYILDDELTYCCSQVGMRFARDLETQIEFHDGTDCETMDEIEQLFNDRQKDNDCYYKQSYIESLPLMEHGDIPEEGQMGCCIEYECEGEHPTTEEREYVVEFFFSDGG